MTKYYTLTDSSGTWRVSLHAPDEKPEGAPHGSEAICMVDDENTVLVRNTTGRLNTPGGHPENGESSEETMIREVREEACAAVTSWQLIAYARSECLEGERKGHVMVRDMYVARVEPLPWVQPEFEIVERLTVPVDTLVATMSNDWQGLDEFSQNLVDLAVEGLRDI